MRIREGPCRPGQRLAFRAIEHEDLVTERGMISYISDTCDFVRPRSQVGRNAMASVVSIAEASRKHAVIEQSIERSSRQPAPPACAPSRRDLFGGDDAPRAPAPPHRRLRQPGHPADRPPPARVAHLLRDPPLSEGRRRLPRRLRAAGGHPLRRPRQRHRRRQPARRAGDLHPRRAGARHLLRPAGDDGPARRQGRGGPPRRVRPRLRHPDRATPRPALHRPLPHRPRGGLDEPRRPRDRARPGLLGHRHLPERPLRHHRRPRAATSTACSSTPRSTTPSTAPGILQNFTDLAGFTGDWTMAAYKDQAIAAIRAAGRRREGDLRPLRRRRLARSPPS